MGVTTHVAGAKWEGTTATEIRCRRCQASADTGDLVSDASSTGGGCVPGLTQRWGLHQAQHANYTYWRRELQVTRNSPDPTQTHKSAAQLDGTGRDRWGARSTNGMTPELVGRKQGSLGRCASN